MGLTAITCLEIFTNPKDLSIGIGSAFISVGEKTETRYCFAIYRGPGHNFKLLADTEPIFKNRSDAVNSVKTSLECICKIGKEILTDPNNIATQIINSDNRPVEKMTVLTQEDIDKIVKELEICDQVGTYSD